MRLPGRNRWKKAAWRTTHVLAGAVVVFALLDLLFPLRTGIPYAPLVRARDGQVLHAFLSSDQQWRFRAELGEITPELKTAIIYKEDRHFYRHFGVNPLAVGRAAIRNLLGLGRRSGASTITMQVARMLQPGRRNYLNKSLEMFRALQLEAHYSKDEILQLYLNLVPYGSNIQGVKAAALLYFGKSPDQLSLGELTALSIIPNRPNSMVMGKDNARIVVARNTWLRRFQAAGLFPDETIGDALAEPLTASRQNAPNAVPQLAWRLRRSRPGELDIRSTIDRTLQQKAEHIVYGYVQSLKLQGVHNAAVLVVDNRTGEVSAYIGSPDFTDRAHAGQVDGVKALRSPGSALKPFLYGLAYDGGAATMQTVLPDVPINLSGYTPENYDLQFRGRVTTEEALRQSLNIPAVKTLQEVGVPQLTRSLGAAGFSSVWQQRKKLGLSMILGGCTVRLEELTGLYAAFANGGLTRPFHWTMPADSVSPSEDSTGFRILSPSANYMVCHTLCELERPDMPQLADAVRNIPRIAWKTGTSYGRKDAWSIGFNAHYTVGVWLGNFDGKGVTALSGAATATPLLFQLFNALDPAAGEEWLVAPGELAHRFVCRETGLPPADSCVDQVMDYYIPGVSRAQRCDHMKEVWESPDGSFSYCTSCLPAAGYAMRSYPNMPGELAAFYDARGISYRRIPPHNPSCSRLFDGDAPVINTLQAGMTYLIIDRGRQGLQLGCQAASDVRKVYWYINDRYYGTAAAQEKLFFNPAGSIVKISCTDDKGRNADMEVKVKFL